MSRLTDVSSEQLLATLRQLVRRGRELESELIEHLGEVDARRLHLRDGFPSMFAYCVTELGFAEAVAYKRISAARAARRFPALLGALRAGELHLTAVSLLAPQLSEQNVAELMAAARHRTADEIRRLLADRRPKPDVASSVRRLPRPSVRRESADLSASAVCDDLPDLAFSSERGASRACGASRAGADARADERAADVGSRGVVPGADGSDAGPHATRRANGSRAGADSPPRPVPLGGERFLIRFTADRELHAQIEQLRSLMRHQIPDGDLGKILAKAVVALLEQVRARKFGEFSKPRSVRAPRTAQSVSATHSTRTPHFARAVRTDGATRTATARRAGGTTADATVAPTGAPAAFASNAAEPTASRRIPAAIRRAVSKRDGRRCTFVAESGRRCGSRDFLEFHHREPWAWKQAHSVDGIALRCRAHNQYQAELDFGAARMRSFRRQ